MSVGDLPYLLGMASGAEIRSSIPLALDRMREEGQARSGDTVRSRSLTGKPARQLRSAWTDAWDDPSNPDPLPMFPYAKMERALAAETGERFLDTARFLHAQRDSTLFLDDCHLSEKGHRVLAAEIARDLERTGW